MGWGGGGGGSKLSLSSEGFERGVDWAELTGRPAPPAVRPAGIQTADLQVNGRVHYHWIIACPDGYCSLTACSRVCHRKNPNCVFLYACLPACLLARLTACLTACLTN